MKSFNPVQKHYNIDGTLNPNGLILGLKFKTAGPAIFVQERTANGETYNSYSVVGTTTDANGAPKKVTAKLKHILTGSYGNATIENSENEVQEFTSLDELLEGAETTPVMRNGAAIEGIRQISGFNLKFTPSAEVQDFLFLKTDNAPMLTTVLASAPVVTEDEFDSLFAQINDDVLASQN